MVVVPQAEEQRKQNNNCDDRELPAAAEENKETSEGDRRGRCQKQDRAHAEPLTDQNGSDGEGDEKRDRDKRHHRNADECTKFELARMPHVRGHRAEEVTAQGAKQVTTHWPS